MGSAASRGGTQRQTLRANDVPISQLSHQLEIEMAALAALSYTRVQR